MGHFTANCPTLPNKEKERIMKAREQNKGRKQKTFPINLEECIRNSSNGLTIEEAMKMMPGYKKILKLSKREKKSIT